MSRPAPYCQRCGMHHADPLDVLEIATALDEREEREDFVPLSVRDGNRRRRVAWWWSGRRERLALRLAPWLRGPGRWEGSE